MLVHGDLFNTSSIPGLGGREYVGYVPPNKKLGIPALTLNDGPQGFRCVNCGGTTTSWPSGLTVGATFDPEMSTAWGDAMGAEFAGKGANIQLYVGVYVACILLVSFSYLPSIAGVLLCALQGSQSAAGISSTSL
jgi:hypothetical protein